MSRVTERRERAEHANQLIRVIADHGRRFFWNEKHQRYASIEVDAGGRVWFIDDYSGKRIYTHWTPFGNKWRGFTHGGTLRTLVECMRDYIVDGKRIARWRIAQESLHGTEDIWGYGRLAAFETRTKAWALPIIMPLGESDV